MNDKSIPRFASAVQAGSLLWFLSQQADCKADTISDCNRSLTLEASRPRKRSRWESALLLQRARSESAMDLFHKGLETRLLICFLEPIVNKG
jgi:hypothetical protein